MCKPGSQIKLCACSDLSDKPRYPYWILYCRVDGDDRPIMVMGNFLAPKKSNSLYSQWLEDIESELQESLNSGEAFDFEYIPSGNDVFALYTSKSESLQLEYVAWNGTGAWQKAEDFNHIERFHHPQHKPIKKGKLKTQG